MLISVHLPKTAGSSFKASLEKYYTSGLQTDYTDFPINTPAYKRNSYALKMCAINAFFPQHNIECIHGHFLPVKYLFYKNAKFVTWLREPIDRLASHYYYWKRSYNPTTSGSLHKRVVEENWSLEEFCLAPELRNFYCQFLWGFPISRFDFIGITEYYESEVAQFSKIFLGDSLEIHVKNINPNKFNSSYFEDKALREKIEQYHYKDLALYHHALDLRTTRNCTLNLY